MLKVPKMLSLKRTDQLTEHNILDYIESKLRQLRTNGYDIRKGSIQVRKLTDQVIDILYYTNKDLIDFDSGQTSLFHECRDISSFALAFMTTYKSAYLKLEPRIFGEDVAAHIITKKNIDDAFFNYEFHELKKSKALDCLCAA